ncbi:MAG: TatD family hydrolase [Candidatus Uhrbacteria bacterium]
MAPFLIDTHCHVNFSAYKDDSEDVIGRAAAQGIAMNAVGSQRDTSRRAVSFAEQYENIWAIVGLHPIHLIDSEVDREEIGEEGEGIAFRTRAEVFEPEVYRELAQHAKTVAIGECGLDWFHIPDGHDPQVVMRQQEEVFRAQIALAQEVGLPLMVHVRDANPDAGPQRISALDAVLRILEDVQHGWSMDPPYGVLHCYAGTWEQAERFFALGYDISFTGIITFRPTRKHREATERLLDVVGRVPSDRYLVETDAPYLSPDPHRGERNEPSYVRHVAECVAALRGETLEVVARQSTENALRLFRKMC